MKRAYELATKASDKNVQTLGELIHNPEVLEELKNRGVRTVPAVSKLRNGTVIIRAHGVSEKVKKKLESKKLKIIDASCPFVMTIHNEVNKFMRRGIPCVIVGRRDHPEMKAIVEDFPEVLVVSRISDFRLKSFRNKKVALLAQTTETLDKFNAIAKRLEDVGAKVIKKKTICSATSERQKAAIELAHKVDLVIVIGGKKSNNTKQLYQLTKKIRPSYWIESEGGLKSSWLRGVKKVGITAGASTPEAVIERVEKRLQEINES